MKSEANFDTGVTYLRAGLTERARESFERALADVAPAARVAENGTYLKTLTLLARLHLERGAAAAAIQFIDQGLAVKPGHCDLLFLRALCCWEQKRFDEMFLALIHFLAVMAPPATEPYLYEFTHAMAVKEVCDTLLPKAYRHSTSRGQTHAVVQRLAEQTGNPLLEQACRRIAEIDQAAQAEAP